jgi:hypothetical protein
MELEINGKIKKIDFELSIMNNAQAAIYTYTCGFRPAISA